MCLASEGIPSVQWTHEADHPTSTAADRRPEGHPRWRRWRRFNEAATFAAKAGFEAGVFTQPSVHKLCYREIRERFGLSAQMAVRAIGKAVECFRRDKAKCPAFKPHGAVTYDERILGFKGIDRVSLWTLPGRMLLPLVYGAYQGERFDRIKGQCDLVHRRGKFFLYATVDLPEGAPVVVTDFLGVDLGLAKIATDSDGNAHSGAAVEAIRRKHNLQRKRLGRCNSKGAKKKLKRIAGKEARFRKHENHRISKAIVAKAKDTVAGSPSKTSRASAIGSRFGPRTLATGSPAGRSRNWSASSRTRPDWRASPW